MKADQIYARADYLTRFSNASNMHLGNLGCIKNSVCRRGCQMTAQVSHIWLLYRQDHLSIACKAGNTLGNLIAILKFSVLLFVEIIKIYTCNKKYVEFHGVLH